MNDAVLGAFSALITAGFLYGGSRFVAKQTRAVGDNQVEVERQRVEQEARKVDQEAFDRFIQRYETDRTRQEGIIGETRGLLRSALKHINLLRGEMRKSSVIPPALPDDLQDLPWDIYENDPRL